MSQSMSYAEALNEAKGMIVQQQYRIKADAEKLKAQQQQIVDQSATLLDAERRGKEQAAEIDRLLGEIDATTRRLAEAVKAEEQAEAVVNRQGQQITTLQSAVAAAEKKAADAAEQLAAVSAERDMLFAQIPTTADEEALSAMADLLNKRPSSLKRSAPAGGPIRLAEVISEPDAEERAAA